MEKMKPILFSTPMVRAILAGNKTQTRRVINPQPVVCGDMAAVPNPKCRSGDILWVREAWGINALGEYMYRAGATVPQTKTQGFATWKPSIFMPRAAARIFLRVTGVGAERVQDISEEDAGAEGYGDNFCIGCGSCTGSDCYDPRRWFQVLWQDINGKRGFGWDVNPWVWVYEFAVERIVK